MTYEPHALRRAEAQGEAVSRSNAFEWFARAGLAARGLIYGIVGLLALKLALGEGGETTSQQGALKEIAQQPFGKALLIATAIGLAGYATGGSSAPPSVTARRAGDDDTVERVGGVVSGIGYTLLCVAAIDILFGSSGGSGGAVADDRRRAGLDRRPVDRRNRRGAHDRRGAAPGLQGDHQGVPREVQNRADERRVKSAFTKLGIFGHLARMVVFTLIGYFLLKAAIDYNPDAAVTLDGALAKLAQAAYGPLALGVVAAGLLGFGLYSLADARYRRV